MNIFGFIENRKNVYNLKNAACAIKKMENIHEHTRSSNVYIQKKDNWLTYRPSRATGVNQVQCKHCSIPILLNSSFYIRTLAICVREWFVFVSIIQGVLS